MKLEKKYIPIIISLVASTITILIYHNWEEASLQLLVKMAMATFYLSVIFYVALLFKRIRDHINIATTNSAFIIYFGAILISMSRFKSAIAKADIDFSLVGIGLAIIAIGFALIKQREDWKHESQDNSNNTPNKSSSQDKSSPCTRIRPISLIILLLIILITKISGSRSKK